MYCRAAVASRAIKCSCLLYVTLCDWLRTTRRWGSLVLQIFREHASHIRMPKILQHLSFRIGAPWLTRSNRRHERGIR